MLRPSIAIVLLAACGAPSKPPLPPERDDTPGKGSGVSVTAGEAVATAKPLPAPPAGFATADLVTMRGGELATWSAVDGKLTKLGSVTLADIPEGDLVEARAMSSLGKGHWADRDHLFLTLAGAREVVMVTATAITRVTIPPAKDFETAKPADPDGDIEKANNVGIDSEGLQVDDKGDVFWSQCAWGRGYDGYICDAWVHAQLWPIAKRSEGPGAITARSWSWPKPPAGFKATIKDRTLSCSGPAGRSAIQPGTADDTDEEFDAVQWVSAQPPRMLVTYGHAGLADVIAERWTLHDGCTIKPLASGGTAEPGPAGFWIGVAKSDESDGPATLYRGAQTLGPLPDHARVMFRPR